MTTTNRALLGALLSGTMLWPVAAAAQTTTQPDEAAEPLSAEIIVTAQKREERLQDVPVAVSVVSGAAIEQQGRLNLEGAQFLVPTLNFAKSGTTLNQSLFLRGVGTSTFSIAGEPSISTVVDGVVLSRAGEAFGDLFDVERIEVLRGPQGTLFGKNASAGVINIVTRRPGEAFGGYLEAGVFTKREYRVRGAVDLPLAENFRTRFTGFYTDWDGNISNPAAFRGKRVNGLRHYGFRGQAAVDLSPAVKLNFSADYSKNNDDCCADVIATPPVNTTPGQATSGQFVPNLSTAALPTPRFEETRAINQNFLTRTIETTAGGSLQLDAELGGQTLTSITAYRSYRNNELRDGDFLDRPYIGFNQLHDTGPQTGNTLTQELRLTSPGRQFIDYVVGAFYSRAFSRRIFQRDDIVCGSAVTPPPAVLTPCSSPLATPSTTPSGRAEFGSTFQNLAFFGQAQVNLTENFRVIAGLRYTLDQLDVFHRRVATGLATNAAGFPVAAPGIQPNFDQGVFDRYQALVAAGVAPNVAAAQAPLGSNGQFYRAKTSNDNLSGRAGVQFDFSDAVMAYGTYARGYKGPAYNIFFNLTGTGTNRIAPETADAFEVGLKNTLLGGQLVLNLAAYYAKYKNFQANNPDVVAGVVVTRFTNAGTISTRGGELDLLWRPTRELTISGGAAYTDAKVDRFNAPVGAAPLDIIPDGQRLAFAPKFKGSLGIDYRFRTGGIEPFIGVQGSYQSKQLSQLSGNPIIRQFATIKDYGLVNLQVGFTDADERFRLTGQVRNLFDTAFPATITSGGPGNAFRYQIPRDADRYYGITGRVNF